MLTGKTLTASLAISALLVGTALGAFGVVSGTLDFDAWPGAAHSGSELEPTWRAGERLGIETAKGGGASSAAAGPDPGAATARAAGIALAEAASGTRPPTLTAAVGTGDLEAGPRASPDAGAPGRGPRLNPGERPAAPAQPSKPPPDSRGDDRGGARPPRSERPGGGSPEPGAGDGADSGRPQPAAKQPGKGAPKDKGKEHGPPATPPGLARKARDRGGGPPAIPPGLARKAGAGEPRATRPGASSAHGKNRQGASGPAFSPSAPRAAHGRGHEAH